MKPRFFKTPTDFRAWLEKNHAKTPELWVGFYKKGSGKKGITYAEALDEALSFGWIDGLTRGLDEATWTIRFTPRKARSHWSAININRFGELKAEGRVRPSGLAAFEARDATERKYSYEAPPRRLDPKYEKRLRANKRAWAYWESEPPSYRRAVMFWVMSAKREETRQRRLDVLLESSLKGERVPPLRQRGSARKR
jgi:uncharacterized protein YdeI (YjbR/CyaY-like superfamily)